MPSVQKGCLLWLDDPRGLPYVVLLARDRKTLHRAADVLGRTTKPPPYGWSPVVLDPPSEP